MRIQHRYSTFKKDQDLIYLLNKLTSKHKTVEKSFDETNHFYALEFILYEDNPRFPELKDAVDYFNLVPQITTLYEQKDYDAAKWFILRTGQFQYPQPENSYLDKTFDLENYCPSCGMGRVQNAPFRLKTVPKQLNSQFWGLHWVYEAVFIRQRAMDLLDQLRLRGTRFTHPVINKSEKPISDFY